MASCSATWSRAVIPRSTRPSPTKVGMSAAGRKIRAIGRFLTSAMSRRVSRRNWTSQPARRSRVACWRRPSVLLFYKVSRALFSYVCLSLSLALMWCGVSNVFGAGGLMIVTHDVWVSLGQCETCF